MNPALAAAADEFSALMARFAPFERCPHLAVAVSGGADSLALALLAQHWAASAGGRITALTVDHRLRPESAVEAAAVGAVLARHGIVHRILVREGAAPAANIEAAARAARYRLLESWCGENRVLHLLMAHHREDQAETVLLRLARGSGLDGLAGMAALVERSYCRILRPVLGLPRARLAAVVAAVGGGIAEDPMNRDPAFARARLRAAGAALAREGVTAERLAVTAQRLGHARTALEAARAALLARAVMLPPAGFAWLDPAPLAAAPEDIALRALAALLAMVSGASYPPRLRGSAALLTELRAGLSATRTLGGCVVVPRRGRVLVCREPALAAPPVSALPGVTCRWDGRFVLTMPAAAPGPFNLGALGSVRGPWSERNSAVPAPARATLPALRDGDDGDGVAAVPHLGYVRHGTQCGSLSFRPTRGLTGGEFMPA